MSTPLAHAPRTARVLWLGAAAVAALVAAAGCGAGEPVAPPPGPPAPPPPPPGTVSAPAPSGQRGAACSPSEPCAAGMLCSPMPGGYCTSFCGLVGTACDGACAETARAGEIC